MQQRRRTTSTLLFSFILLSIAFSLQAFSQQNVPEHGIQSPSQMIFKAISSYHVGTNITNQLSFHLHPDRQVFLNPSSGPVATPTYTILDEIQLNLSVGTQLTPYLNVGGEIDFTVDNYRQWQTPETADSLELSPLLDAAFKLNHQTVGADIERGTQWMTDQLAQKVSGNSAPPDSPSWDTIVSPYNLLFHLPFHAQDLLNGNFNQDDILSYTTYGRAFVGAGLDINHGIETAANVQAYLDGYFRITILKLDGQKIKMKIEYFGEDGLAMHAGLTVHKIIHLGRLYTNGKDVRHEFFDLNASEAQSRMLESVWIMDLGTEEGRTAYEAAIKGSMQSLHGIASQSPAAVSPEYDFQLNSLIDYNHLNVDIGVFKFETDRTLTSDKIHFELPDRQQDLYLAENSLQFFEQVDGVFKDIDQREDFFIKTRSWTDSNFALLQKREVEIFCDYSILNSTAENNIAINDRATAIIGGQKIQSTTAGVNRVVGILTLSEVAIQHAISALQDSSALWSFFSDHLNIKSTSGQALPIKTDVDRSNFQQFLNLSSDENSAPQCTVSVHQYPVDCAKIFDGLNSMVTQAAALDSVANQLLLLDRLSKVMDNMDLRYLLTLYINNATQNDPRKVVADLFGFDGRMTRVENGNMDDFFPAHLDDFLWNEPRSCGDVNQSCVNLK